MKLSVIIAAYNAADTLDECVRSVLAQTMPDLEVIVVDDASPDGTAAAALALQARDGRVRLVRQAVNGGPSAARNAGLDAARGEWIMVVDSDDTIAPDRAATMLAAAERTGADIVFDNLTIVARDGQSALYIPDDAGIFGDLPLAAFIQSHRRSCSVPSLGFLKPLVRRAAVEGHAVRYWPDMRVSEDTMFIVSLMARGAKAHLLRAPYYTYKKRAGSLSDKYNAGNMRRFDLSFRRFMDGNRDRLDPAALLALDTLIAENLARLTAREALDALVENRRLDGLPRVLRDKTVRSYFIQEAASGLKRFARRLRARFRKNHAA